MKYLTISVPGFGLLKKSNIMSAIAVTLAALFILPAELDQLQAKEVEVKDVKAKWELPKRWKSRRRKRKGKVYYQLTRTRTRLKATIRFLEFDEAATNDDVLDKFLAADKKKKYKITFTGGEPSWEKAGEELLTQRIVADMKFKRRRRRFSRIGGIARFKGKAITVMVSGRTKDFKRYGKEVKEIIRSITFIDDVPIKKEEPKKEVKKTYSGKYAASPEEEKFFEY